MERFNQQQCHCSGTLQPGTQLPANLKTPEPSDADPLLGLVAGAPRTLDQWGISAKTEEETLPEYLTRVFSSSVFTGGFKDVCLWSLSTSGAAEENTGVTTLPDVYYYSYATMDTYSTYDWLLRKISLPSFLTMLLPLDIFAIFLGSRYGPNHGFSTDWQPNDGLVNTISMVSDSTGKVVSYSGSSQIGQWNQMTQLSNMDHVSVMGITLLTQVLELYSAHAKLLLSLPVSSSRRQLTDGAIDEVSAAITSLNAAASNVKTLKKRCASPANDLAEAYCTNLLGASGSTHYLRG